MGFLIAEVTLMLVLSAVAGAALCYWWVRRQYRDVTSEYRSLEVDLETAQMRLAAPPLDLTPHEEPRPQSNVSSDTLAALLGKVEQVVSNVNDAQVARVKAMESQLRSLSRQLQDTLPHPVDGQDIARRLDTLGAAIPQPKLNSMEARLARLETMVTGLCTQAGTEIPPPPMASRLPSSPSHNSRLPSSPANQTPSGFGSNMAKTSSGAPSAPPSKPPSRAPGAGTSSATPSSPASSPPSMSSKPPGSVSPSSVVPKAPRPRAV
jgi:hypothetical protein